MNHDPLHAQYNLQALLWVARLAAENQWQLLKQLGLRPEQIEKIRHCSVSDLQEMVNALDVHLVTPLFDAEALDLGFRLVHRRHDELGLAIRLIEAGATSSLIRAHYGLTNVEITGYREQYGPPKTAGRPPKPSAELQYCIWKLWAESPDWTDLNLPQRLLRIHDETGVLIRTISMLIRKWENGGELPEVPPPAESQEGRPS